MNERQWLTSPSLTTSTSNARYVGSVIRRPDILWPGLPSCATMALRDLAAGGRDNTDSARSSAVRAVRAQARRRPRVCTYMHDAGSVCMGFSRVPESLGRISRVRLFPARDLDRRSTPDAALRLGGRGAIGRCGRAVGEAGWARAGGGVCVWPGRGEGTESCRGRCITGRAVTGVLPTSRST